MVPSWKQVYHHLRKKVLLVLGNCSNYISEETNCCILLNWFHFHNHIVQNILKYGKIMFISEIYNLKHKCTLICSDFGKNKITMEYFFRIRVLHTHQILLLEHNEKLDELIIPMECSLL